jgi:hypothetical protein
MLTGTKVGSLPLSTSLAGVTIASLFEKRYLIAMRPHFS